MPKRLYLILFALCFFVLQSGCAEGPFWKSGKFSPWAREKWAEEERIADTLFVRKQKMTESVNAALNASLAQQQQVAGELSEIVHRDPVLLIRLHGVKLLSQLNCPAALETLADASRDYNTDIRIAAVKAWESKPAESAIPQLQEMIGSDTNVDVRLAATRALGTFSGTAAVEALALALNDPDPALQVRATESLQRATGEPLGRDVIAWQDYVQRYSADSRPATQGTGKAAAVASRIRNSVIKR